MLTPSKQYAFQVEILYIKFAFPEFLRKKYVFSGWLLIVLTIQYLLTSNTEPELRDNKIPRKALEPANR